MDTIKKFVSSCRSFFVTALERAVIFFRVPTTPPGVSYVYKTIKLSTLNTAAAWMMSALVYWISFSVIGAGTITSLIGVAFLVYALSYGTDWDSDYTASRWLAGAFAFFASFYVIFLVASLFGATVLPVVPLMAMQSLVFAIIGYFTIPVTDELCRMSEDLFALPKFGDSDKPTESEEVAARA